MAYFANGSEGGVLDAQCADCPIGSDPNAPCAVLLAQTLYNYKQIGNALAREILNVLIDDSGMCQMKKSIEKAHGGFLKGRGDLAQAIGQMDLPCGACKHPLFNLRFEEGTSGSVATWIRVCQKCGHEAAL
ncbi:hypothetical protein [Thiocapsa sp. N5-Cardenillas]|uniref:hypothetical protein n=1 Tax=Thiocapsa sp. N5-Cardenillas TaxID=3137397 RepID=UPI0035B122B6